MVCVLQYKGINFWHVGCTDKQNKPKLSVISESSLQCTT